MNLLASRQDEPAKPLVGDGGFALGGDDNLDCLHVATSYLNGEFDRAVSELLFRDEVALAAGLDAAFLDGVGLEEAIEFLSGRPSSR